MIIVKALVTILGSAGVIILLFVLFQDKLIFFPQPLPNTNRQAFIDHEFTVLNGDVALRGWFVKGNQRTSPSLIIYYGGNAEEVSENLKTLDQIGPYSFLFMNFRGYGDSEGKPSEHALFNDALHIFDTITKQENIASDQVVLMGRSMGTGLAVYVAKHRHVQGVILVSPFDSLLHMARRHYPFLPSKRFLKHHFDSISLAPEIQTPVLCLIGNADTTVPNSHSKNLMNSWAGPHNTITIDGADHNTIWEYPEYWQSIREFIESLNQTDAPPSEAGDV